jgi:hypothetical protein
VEDFVTIPEQDTVRILNVMSTAFTSSMAFAKRVIDGLLEHEATGAVPV